MSDPNQPGAPEPGQPQHHQAPQTPPQGAQQGQQQYGAPQPPQYGAWSPQQAPMAPAEEKNMAMFAHLSGITMWLGPLIFFLIFKDRSRFVNQESKEALNFQLTMTIALIGLFVLCTLITIFTFGLAGFLMVFVYVPWILSVIFAIIGAVKVNGGGAYRYPMSLRLIK